VPTRFATRGLGVALVALALLTTACGSASGATSRQLVSIGAGLRGPTGLTASVYATGLANVSVLTTDDRGRLWAATAAYSGEGTDGVYVVAHAGATAVEVVSGLTTVMGLVWHDGALYVASAGGVVLYRDFDGTSFSAHETVLAIPDGTGLVGNLVLRRDGRFLVGVSAPCDACTPSSAWSAAVLSFLADGSDVQVFASGIRAPVGLTWFPGTTQLFVTMNQRDDLGARTPGDWLAIVREGDDWRFPGCSGQGGTACAGVPSPVAVLDRHAAASGVAVVRGGPGGGTGTTAFVAEWAKGKVLRVPLSKRGSATGRATSFLTGLKSPVPVLAATDGSLVVGDWATGTVYRIATA
jgi:hypothetical protein